MADATTWRKRVAAWRASGKTAAEYCDEHSLGLSSLRYWAQRVRREVAAAPAVRLARVERIPTRAAMSRSPAPVVIEVGAVRIQVDQGVDPDTLATVLEVLARSPR